MSAPMTADPGRRRLIAAAALRVHSSSEIDATDAAVLARRVDVSADAIAANTRGEVPVSTRQRAAALALALALALDMLITARRHGVTRPDLDGVMTLAGSAVDAVLARDRRRPAGALTHQLPRHQEVPSPSPDR
jgi:hypothetical protein